MAPLAKYIDAIRLFPTPQNITDIRSLFGLVNQVAGYGQLRSFLQPFRKFLSPKVKFKWTASLEDAFKAGKNEIIRAIDGVKIFNPSLETCIRTDWSKEGMGATCARRHADALKST